MGIDVNTDTLLVVGILGVALAIPSVLSAFSEGRAPRLAAILFMFGGGCLALAVTQKPGGYDFADIPGVFSRVIGGLF